MRILAMLAACILAAGCTTTAVKSANQSLITAAAPNAKGLLVQPDVQLSLLTAAGLQERREDWSRQGRENLAAAIQIELTAHTHRFELLDPASSMDGRPGQLLRLHEAVGQSVLAFTYGPMHLPTKKAGFDWTLGDGTSALRDKFGADYALFVTARGSYASAGRKVAMIGMAMLGVGIPLGSQQVFASLVDLRTGRVVWFNVATAGPQADIRNPEGAGALAKDLLKGVPL